MRRRQKRAISAENCRKRREKQREREGERERAREKEREREGEGEREYERKSIQNFRRERVYTEYTEYTSGRKVCASLRQEVYFCKCV